MIGNKFRRVRRAALICGAATSLLISATISTSSASSKPAPYTIGISAGVTGAAAAIVKGELQGAQAYIRGVNGSGGVNGHLIKLVTLDTQNVATTAVATFTQLVTQDNAKAVIGDVLSDNCDAQLTVATRYKVPVICGTLDPTSLKPAQLYGYTEYGAEDTETSAITSIIANAPLHIANPKIALIYIATASDQPLFNAVSAAASSIGGSVVFNDPIGIQLDLSTDAQKAIAAGANVIVEQIIPQQLQSLEQSLQNDGSNIPIVAEASTASYDELNLLQGSNIYQMALNPFVNVNGTQPAVKTYVKALAAEGVTGQSGINGQSVAITYATTAAIVQAMKICGKNCTSEQIAKALQKVNVQLAGINSDYSYTATRHYPQTNFYLYSYNASKGGVYLVQKGIQGNSL